MMQPYAWLFANGFLQIDDRSRSTSVRGPVAIHASRRFHREYYDFLRANTDWLMPEISEFEQGGIVGVADLVDCLAPIDPQKTDAAGRRIDLLRAHFGAPGFFGYVFKNPKQVPLAPCRGNLGFFQVPEVGVFA